MIIFAKNYNFAQKGKSLFVGSLAILALASIPVWLKVATSANFEKAGGANLAGSWQICALDNTAPDQLLAEMHRQCHWETGLVPGAELNSSIVHRRKQWLLYRRHTLRPKICRSALDDCHFVIGSVVGPSYVWLNGHYIGSHGSTNPIRYAGHFPVRLRIESRYWQDEGPSEILVAAYNLEKEGRGITVGPIGITDPGTASFLHRAVSAFTVILPLFAAVILLLVLAVLLALFYVGKRARRQSIGLAWYCAGAMIWLVSLTRLPREYLDYDFAKTFHPLTWYAFYLGLSLALQRFLTPDRPIIKIFVLLSVPFILFSAGLVAWQLSIGGLIFGYEPHTLSYKAMAISLFSAAGLYCVALYYSYKNIIRSTGHVILFWSLAVLLPMHIWDSLAFWQLVPEVYYSRFSPFFLAFAFCYITLENWIMEYSTEKKDAEIGRLAASVVHDIKVPLAALKIASKRLGKNNIDERSLLTEAISRISEIADGLLNYHRSRHASAALSVKSTTFEILSRSVRSLAENLKTTNWDTKRAEVTVVVNGVESNTLLIECSRFLRATANLIQNAIEASPYASVVDVELQLTDVELSLSVWDLGPGVNMSVRRLVESGTPVSHKETGNGIGLLSVREYVLSAGGQLRFGLTRKRRGAGVQFAIPIRQVEYR